MLSPLVKAADHAFSDVQTVTDFEIPTPAAPAQAPSPGPAQSDPTSLALPYIDVKLDFTQKVYWAAMRPSQHPMITMELLRDMMCVQESVRAIMEEVLLPVMYDIPSRDDVAKVVVTAGTVNDNVLPTIVPRKPERERRDKTA